MPRDRKRAGVAKEIVDGVLDTVERAGYFMGRGKKRRLFLSSIITKTGEVESVHARTVEWVASKLTPRRAVRIRRKRNAK